MYARRPSPNAARQEAEEGRVKHFPVSNFQFWHDPDDWVIDFRGKLQPTLVHMSKAVGAGAVSKRGDFTPQRIYLEKRGWIGIPHQVLGDGPDADYIAAYVNTKGQTVCRTVFESGYRGPGGETEWAFDQEAYDMFIRLLRRRRLIPSPRPQVVAGLLEQYRQRLAFLLKRRPGADTGALLDQHKDQVALHQEAIANLEGELADAEGVWGAIEAPGRVAVLDALQRLEQEAAEEDAAEAELLARRALSTTPPPAPESPPEPPELAPTVLEDPKPRAGRRRK